MMTRVAPLALALLLLAAVRAGRAVGTVGQVGTEGRETHAVTRVAQPRGVPRQSIAAAQQPSCRDQAWALAAQGRFRTAANALALCSDVQSPAELAVLAHLAQAEGSLQRRDWPAAAAAMHDLAAVAPAALPAQLDPTLAPAFVRFGAGAPTAAAALARAPERRRAALALPFQAFLRHQYAAWLWRRLSIPALLCFLAVLLAGFIAGLRRVLEPA